MTNATVAETKTVCRVMYCQKTLRWPSWYLRSRRRLAADVQKIGPAQLLTKVRIPTAKKLKPLIPLYALERSTEEMAFEPPKAKNVVC